ncbi:MAG: hypothetical protein LUC43_09185, partial [Burkholderiales bacterium]|nr:hypothetical protein [Burkholderiales bacterium]
VADATAKLDGKRVRVRGILFPKTRRKKYSEFTLKMLEEDAEDTDIDFRRVSLSILAFGQEAEVFEELISWEVVVEGDLNIKLWLDSSSASISLLHPKVVKAVGEIVQEEDPQLKEILSAFAENPMHKPRGEAVIESLTNIVKKRKLNVLVIGPEGKGTGDIIAEFERAEGLNEHVELKRVNQSLSPGSYAKAQVKAHFIKLGDEIREYAKSGDYDIICLARGGGDASQLSSLNNKYLCMSIIDSKVPVCAALAHASDNLWLKQCSDLFTNVPAVFVGELVRAVNNAYPEAVQFTATERIAPAVSYEIEEKRRWPNYLMWALWLFILGALAFFLWTLFEHVW